MFRDENRKVQSFKNPLVGDFFVKFLLLRNLQILKLFKNEQKSIDNCLFFNFRTIIKEKIIFKIFLKNLQKSV